MKLKLKLLFCAVLMIVSGVWAKERIIHPNWAPKTIKLDVENITTIMGYRAELSVDEYIKCFKILDQANVPATINLMITADVTKNQPFFNPECIEVMKKVQFAIKGK
jgi:hypothetical protein